MQRHSRRAIGLAVRVFMACFLLLAFFANANSQVHVRGYTKKNGTYVAPHWRSSPNSSRSDNYSSLGNYNPYNGKIGTSPARAPAPVYHAPVPAIRLQTSASPLSWSQYQPQPVAPAPMQISNAYMPPAPQGMSVTSVFRCEDASGTRHYLSYPRAGCAEIQVLTAQQAAPPPRRLVSYGSYRCTSDCSGHEAGYEWAANKGIDDPDDCGGNSQSFIEGCQTYAEEQQGE